MILLKEGPIDQHMPHYKFTKKQMPEWIPRCDLKINKCSKVHQNQNWHLQNIRDNVNI